MRTNVSDEVMELENINLDEINYIFSIMELLCIERSGSDKGCVNCPAMNICDYDKINEIQKKI